MGLPCWQAENRWQSVLVVMAGRVLCVTQIIFNIIYIIRINLSGLIHQSIVVRQVPQHALLSPTGKQTSQ